METDGNRPALVINELHCAPPGRPAVRGVDLVVNLGEFVAITGRNGAAKGTLCRCLCRKIRPEKGEIAFLGRPLATQPVAVARSGFIILLQEQKVFGEMSVRDNLMSSPSSWAPGRDERWSAVMKIFPWMKDRLLQPAATLSGGEQQMVALARAFMANPILMLIEEPSLGLAEQTAKGVYAALSRMCEAGKTVVVTEETLAIAGGYVGRVHVMEQGRILETEGKK